MMYTPPVNNRLLPPVDPVNIQPPSPETLIKINGFFEELMIIVRLIFSKGFIKALGVEAALWSLAGILLGIAFIVSPISIAAFLIIIPITFIPILFTGVFILPRAQGIARGDISSPWDAYRKTTSSRWFFPLRFHLGTILLSFPVWALFSTLFTAWFIVEPISGIIVYMITMSTIAPLWVAYLSHAQFEIVYTGKILAGFKFVRISRRMIKSIKEAILAMLQWVLPSIVVYIIFYIVAGLVLILPILFVFPSLESIEAEKLIAMMGWFYLLLAVPYGLWYTITITLFHFFGANYIRKAENNPILSTGGIPAVYDSPNNPPHVVQSEDK